MLFSCVFFFSYHIQQCADIYGAEFNLSMVSAAVQQTNENYGGFNIHSSRIIFPNGLIDPWHALGITRSLSTDVVAIPMQGNSYEDHYRDVVITTINHRRGFPF